MELARAGIRPDDVMTPDAFDNAIRVLSATGGSTNEFITELRQRWEDYNANDANR